MSEFQGPKCQEMHFPAFSFPKFSRGACPHPPRNDGLKPIVWVLRTQNRLLFKKIRLLKTLKKTLWSVQFVWTLQICLFSNIKGFFSFLDLSDLAHWSLWNVIKRNCLIEKDWEELERSGTGNLYHVIPCRAFRSLLSLNQASMHLSDYHFQETWDDTN